MKGLKHFVFQLKVLVIEQEITCNGYHRERGLFLTAETFNWSS